MEVKALMDKIIMTIAGASVIGLFTMYVQVEKMNAWQEMATAKIQEQDDMIIELEKDIILIMELVKKIDEKLDKSEYFNDQLSQQKLEELHNEYFEERIEKLDEKLEEIAE